MNSKLGTEKKYDVEEEEETWKKTALKMKLIVRLLIENTKKK